MGRFSLLWKAKRIGVVTEKYPFKPTEPPEGFRGKPEINVEKCIGCGACVAECPPSALTMEDRDGYRIIRLFYGRCIFCGRCADICPEQAINLTMEFELASDTLTDLVQEVKLKMVKCTICGKYFGTERHQRKVIDAMKSQGIELDPEILQRCPEHRADTGAKLIGLRREVND